MNFLKRIIAWGESLEGPRNSKKPIWQIALFCWISLWALDLIIYAGKFKFEKFKCGEEIAQYLLQRRLPIGSDEKAVMMVVEEIRQAGGKCSYTPSERFQRLRSDHVDARSRWYCKHFDSCFIRNGWEYRVIFDLDQNSLLVDLQSYKIPLDYCLFVVLMALLFNK